MNNRRTVSGAGVTHMLSRGPEASPENPLTKTYHTSD